MVLFELPRKLLIFLNKPDFVTVLYG